MTIIYIIIAISLILIVWIIIKAKYIYKHECYQKIEGKGIIIKDIEYKGIIDCTNYNGKIYKNDAATNYSNYCYKILLNAPITLDDTTINCFYASARHGNYPISSINRWSRVAANCSTTTGIIFISILSKE